MSQGQAECWCGEHLKKKFSEHYFQCASCHTLVSDQIKPAEYYRGADDGDSLYGRDYWLHHVKELGYPDIYERSRGDLIERNLYWLRDILKYKLPPGKSLELGCCHGGSVHLMRLAGFDASGGEMSPWLCEFGKETFNVPMLCGPIEDLSVKPGSLDLLVMMDVLEHMPDPVGSMKQIVSLLKEDGMVVIQTPCCRGYQRSYGQMQADNERFLLHMKEDEHLYLFNENSVARLLNESGFQSLAFEKPIFDYDMFIFAGKQKLSVNNIEDIDSKLVQTSDGRTALALLDLYALTQKGVADAETLRLQVRQLQQEAQKLFLENQHIKGSVSWYLTKPLRAIGKLFR